MKQKITCIKKLPPNMSVISLALIRNKVKRLRALIREGDIIAQSIAKIIQQLRQADTVDFSVKSYVISKSLPDNIKQIEESLGKSNDLIIKQIRIGKNNAIKTAIAYIDGLANKNFIQNVTLEITNQINSPAITQKNVLNYIKYLPLAAGKLTDIMDFETLLFHIVSGNTVILADGCKAGLVLDSRSVESRSVEEPSSQTVVRGPKDGFTERLRINTALIRQRIKNKNLRIENRLIGQVTKTDVSILYIRGIANDKLVQEVRARLSRINIDGILESSYIEELIHDSPYTLFPTVFSTERPDVITAGLLEGRIAILVDGTPFALLVPALFIQFFQSSEDYYQRFYIGSLIRILRYIAFFLTLLVPSFYIALTTYHQEMIPMRLLTSLAAQREGVPLPAFLEALTMEITFEILKEAGIRMPRAIGSAISIVGALVLGQAAVEAGLISAVMVVVVSLTAISSFIMPSYSMANAVRVLRFGFMLLASMMGIYGIFIGLFTMLLHLCSLRSLGVPYMSPLSPTTDSIWQDSLIRSPFWKISIRPTFASRHNLTRKAGANPQKQ